MAIVVTARRVASGLDDPIPGARTAFSEVLGGTAIDAPAELPEDDLTGPGSGLYHGQDDTAETNKPNACSAANVDVEPNKISRRLPSVPGSLLNFAPPADAGEAQSPECRSQLRGGTMERSISDPRRQWRQLETKTC